MKKYALELNNITHQYGLSPALNNLNIVVKPGEVVCLLGPSGCGKSTALRLAAGLERLQSGQILLDGQLISNIQFQMPPEQRNVGLVFQDYALFPHLTVMENVNFGLKKIEKSTATHRATEALKMVNMDSYKDNYPHTLSGGEQQRVALARALAPEPSIMLLDEPYSGLDSRLRDRVRDQVLHLLKANNCATLMVTHDSEEAMFMADRIVVMRKGQVVQTGTPEDLYCHPIDAFVAGFFGELNFVEGLIVEDGVKSELGLFPSNNRAIGTAVQIVVRPEALSITNEVCLEGTQKALVVESRLLGRTSLVHLSFPFPVLDKKKQKHLHARIPGVVLPKPGSVVGLEIDLSQIFVFEK